MLWLANTHSHTSAHTSTSPHGHSQIEPSTWLGLVSAFLKADTNILILNKFSAFQYFTLNVINVIMEKPESIMNHKLSTETQTINEMKVFFGGLAAPKGRERQVSVHSYPTETICGLT